MCYTTTMVNKDFMARVRALPAKQQIALWVILKKFHKKEGTWFTVAKFGDEMTKYLSPDKPEELGRIIGGILSSLVRNEMIEQFTGGRKPIWTVVPELHRNAKEYEKSIFPVVTFWDTQED